MAFCKQRGEAPDKPFSGQFVTRIPPDLHRQVNVAAAVSGKSLNAWITELLQAAVQKNGLIKSIGQKVRAQTKLEKWCKVAMTPRNEYREDKVSRGQLTLSEPNQIYFSKTSDPALRWPTARWSPSAGQVNSSIDGTKRTKR